MGYVDQLSKIGFPTIAMVVLLLLFALPTIGKAIAEFVNFFGIETKWSKREKDEQDSIAHLKEEIDQLKESRKLDRDESKKIRDQLNDNQKYLKDKLEELQSIVIENQISQYRHSVLDFSNSVMSGRDYNQEAYLNILDTADKYDKMIEKYNLKNGLFDASIKFIREQYAELLKKGFKY